MYAKAFEGRINEIQEEALNRLMALYRSEGKTSAAEALAASYFLSPANQAVVASAIENEKIPGFAESQPESRRRGNPSENQFIGPIDTIVTTTTPTFQWHPWNDADGYVVRIYDANMDLAEVSPVVEVTKCKAVVPLAIQEKALDTCTESRLYWSNWYGTIASRFAEDTTRISFRFPEPVSDSLPDCRSTGRMPRCNAEVQRQALAQGPITTK